jgi:hypothetical protein
LSAHEAEVIDFTKLVAAAPAEKKDEVKKGPKKEELKQENVH